MKDAISLLALKYRTTRIVSTPYIPKDMPVLDENKQPTGEMAPHILLFRGDLFLHPYNYRLVMLVIDKLNREENELE